MKDSKSKSLTCFCQKTPTKITLQTPRTGKMLRYEARVNWWRLSKEFKVDVLNWICISERKKYFISWRLNWIHKCSTGEQGNIFQVFEVLLKGHWKSVIAKKKPLLKNTGHLRPYGRGENESDATVIGLWLHPKILSLTLLLWKGFLHLF